MLISERLKLLRKTKKITQAELARITKTTQQAINRYEKKETKPSNNFFENVKKAIPELNLEWLITGNGEMFINGDNNVVGDNNKVTIHNQNVKNVLEKEIELLEAFNKLPPERQKYYFHKIMAESLEN